MARNEDDFVAWLASRYPSSGAGVRLGIGDDMAILERPDDAVLIASDMLMDGVHFESARHTPEQMGRKALAVNLSDCAAMAVRPRFAVVSVALPETWTLRQAQGLFLGMEPLSERYDCRIVGGDTNCWPGRLVIDVVVLAAPWPGVAPARRDGMRPGDAICVTGRLGGSRRGHHMDFEPRVHEAHDLARTLGNRLHAMMDLSDGLSTDAARLAAASGCGIELDAAALSTVVSEPALSASAGDRTAALEHALDDGEDFELLFAVAATGTGASPMGVEAGGSTDSEPGRGVAYTAVGVAVERAGVWLRGEDSRIAPVPSRGWRHRLA